MAKKLIVLLIKLIVVFAISACNDAQVSILNVSYDPTRELYIDFNKEFNHYWKEKTGQTIRFSQSHGGSGKQARSIIDGLPAEVATLALAYDIQAIQKAGYIDDVNWQQRLPYNSAPYYSTIVLLVREGNPKNIHDWEDLIRSDVQVITPNPKTSGGARWNYLAALGYAMGKHQDEQAAIEFVTKLYRNVPVLDTGARGSTTTFTERNIGDVLISWENEAYLAIRELEDETFEIVYPSISILAETPVVVIDKIVDRRNTREIAEAYLEYLYSDIGQSIIAKHYFRPRSEQILQQYKDTFPVIPLLTIDDFGGWDRVHEKHFSDGAIFDQIYASKR
ncbi:sulfate transporter subunit [Desulfuribacillus stibiiarsenatis]|uniref:Sulfate-binding protein n=1 Tax=Desulfuribacillus stibiiarsenatis TaxID=1390249 RepID=A0A1E5L762_9FIRM|nr:sulfate ABC transporter substrate-binding protein [Desulfuribacillus stibiiarsenatis]OEH85990.1 sulfate transporter subunit [Desulfuribacillus stibiiarsenatis]